MASHPTPVPEPLDARRARFREMVIAVVLLGGWVFQRLWTIPFIGVMVCLGATAGPRMNPILLVWDRIIAPKLQDPVRHRERPEPARAVEIVEAGLLASATVLMALRLESLAVAVSAVIWASTGFSLPNRLYWRARGGEPTTRRPRRSPPR